LKRLCEWTLLLRLFFAKLYALAHKTFSLIFYPLNTLPLVFKGIILGPAIFVITIQLWQWHQFKPLNSAPLPVNTQRIQHPNYHAIATQALAQFKALDEAEQQRVIANLQQIILPFGQWLAALDHTDYRLLCIGESHRDTTRDFLASEFFTQYQFDTLHLELTPNKYAEIEEALNSESDYFPLLNADALQLLRSIKLKNPHIKIHAIEANQEQRANPRLKHHSREALITANFWRNFTRGTRHIVLMGAIHCSNSNPWFYAKVKPRIVTDDQQHTLNLRVLGEHEEGPVEAFVYFLDELGFSGHLAITNTQGFAAVIGQWFPLTEQVTFKPFTTVLIYR